MTSMRGCRGGLAGLSVLALLTCLCSVAWAHQCVSVEIGEAPERAKSGATIRVVGVIENCGDPARGFKISFALARGDRRVRLGGAVVQVRPGESIREHFSLSLPAVPRGEYQLIMVGTAPSGFQDLARRPIHIVP